MPLQSELQSVQPGNVINESDLQASSDLFAYTKNSLELEDDEDEEEDVDFDPFLRGSPEPEASSSLSSEVEGFEADVVDSGSENTFRIGTTVSSKLILVREGHCTRNSVQDEGITVSSEGMCNVEHEETSTTKSNKRKAVLMSKPEDYTVQEKDNGSSSGTDVFNDVLETETNATGYRKPVFDLDDDEAICKRTRAHYSLASFTLDELETFLQETDDEDDLQNIDEEEEYRKFLAAVLQGGNGDDHATNENGNDEDEDNDADFELEIEEALESDLDDCLPISSQKDIGGSGRRPETRQNKRQKASNQSKTKLSGQANRPLRPLLPILPSAPIAPAPCIDGRYVTPETTSHFVSSQQDCLVNGFTPNQIGQLYSLVHEHVQLLIQVYSLCVLEPSRQHIASQVQGLLSDMLQKCEQVLTWRNVPYPSFCFRPPHIHPSESDEHHKYLAPWSTTGSSQKSDHLRDLSSVNNRSQGSAELPSSDERCGHVMTEPASTCQVMKSLGWAPFVCGPILSILDVAPLKLVQRYMDDVSTAVREHQRRYLEATSSVNFEKEPLFLLPVGPSFTDVSGEAVKGMPATPPESNARPPLSPYHRPTKKTLAATLVENTKKQSVALVPKPIAKLAQQFYTLFNPELFPHKPPPLAVANRVLFTDAEDELLAMGLMEYNTDWKAIQQRFLPCKSKHQIFVRQKNRCSSKAPENPIKAVRRLKTSPLTAEERARIHEGLRVFKLDWMSIWKFIVPYRDPSLLPRQWRIALGTQKSYRMDSAKREKRRLYESKRRSKISAMRSLHASDKETENAGEQNGSGEDCMENDNEAYVHEAFLADWRPAPLSSGCQPNLSAEGNMIVREESDYHGNHESQSERFHVKFAARSEDTNESDSSRAHFRSSESYNLVSKLPYSDFTLKPFSQKSFYRPYRARRPTSSQLVRLAPDLPPVNLPPSVRVISQAAFRSLPHAAASSTEAGAGCSATGEARIGDVGCGPTHIVKSASYLVNATHNRNYTPSPTVTKFSSQDSGSSKSRCVTEEKGTDSDLQMHPLLFRAPEDGRLPYYPLSCSSRNPSSFSFFPVKTHQINLIPFPNPRPTSPVVAGLQKSSRFKDTVSVACGLDFHPLLQRNEAVNNDSIAACTTAQFSVDLELSRDGFSHPNCHYAGKTASKLAASVRSTGPNGDANGLDLEINLSSVPRKDKDASKDGAACNLMASSVSAAHSVEDMLDTQNIHASNEDGGCIKDGTVNQSLLGIVMEQEELSDSDEEIEHVEFECEEMADSDGEEEGSDCEQIVNTQDKEHQDVTPGGKCGDGHHESIVTCGNSQGNSGDRIDRTSSNSLLSTPGKENTASSWLSLNSHSPLITPKKSRKRFCRNLPSSSSDVGIETSGCVKDGGKD
ncbi:hypothetical protein Ancab_033486 [Ancistrocladus abbreviatus]